jgi:hypothetical protein
MNGNMKKTSAYVDSCIYFEIQSISTKFGISNSKIAKDLILIAINSFNSGKVFGSLTEYQNHKPVSWERLYYQLNIDEAEFFSISRQKFKISISKLLFIGFSLFWKQLVYKYKNRISKVKIKIKMNSYDRFTLLYSDYISYFKKRFKIIKKE